MTAAVQQRTRRHDPDRRSRLIDVCLEVIVENGVAGTTHRKVAAAADVPLGSLTYHFSGLDELLREAFTRFAESVSDQFERRMAAAETPGQAVDAVIAIITEDVFEDRRSLVLSLELYTLAAREKAYREVTTAWMARSRRALERHFDPLTARLLDALIEGLTIHRALGTERHEATMVASAVRRIVDAHP